MVRASTRSKTATSLATAKTSPKKKVAAVKEAAAKAAVTAKVKPKAAPKPPPRKGTRASARGKKQSEDAQEQTEGDAVVGTEGDVHVGEEPAEEKQEDENQVEMSEAAEPAFAPDQAPEEEAPPLSEDQEQQDLTVAAPDDTAEDTEKTYCICNGADDGSPMITCEVCDNWFHFHCIDIDEDQADDIATYICPKCHETTGKSTAMKWELTSEDGKKAQDSKDQGSEDEGAAQGSPSEEGTPRPPPSSSSSSDDDDDDYFDDYKKAKQNKRTISDRRVAPGAGSHSPSPSPPVSPRLATGRRRKPSTRLLESSRNSFLKRKTSMSQPELPDDFIDDHDDDMAPTPKRPRPAKSRSKGTIEQHTIIPEETSYSAADDPTRKYCLGKLREVVTPIFVQHYTASIQNPPETAVTAPPAGSPNVGDDEIKIEGGEDAAKPDAEESKPVEGETTTTKVEEPAEKTEEDVSMMEPAEPPAPPPLDEAKRLELEQQASAFVEELEQCIFEGFSEPDKKGRKSAGQKYKERFRMLTFNLEKSDRTELRTRIATGKISPAELSNMASVDLANEALQAEIEQMQEAAMKNSILEARRLAPRAKITHKGEELIEDESGANLAGPSFEEQEERKAEEGEQDDDEQTGEFDDDMSMRAPMSPLDEMIAHSPLTLMTDDLQAATSSAGGFDISEVLGDMGLAGGTPVDHTMVGSPALPVRPSITIPRSNSISGPKSSTNPLLASALASASTSHSHFNLSSVWGGDGAGGFIGGGGGGDLEAIGLPEPDVDGDDVGLMMEDTAELEAFIHGGELFEPADAAEEMDVEPMVDAGEEAIGVGVKSDMEVFEELPVVWTGPVQMPNEQDGAWTSPCHARQIGGRSLGTSDFLWKLLFTQPTTRIDGRVPVPASTKYLVDTRLNPTKDLVAVALTPLQDGDPDFVRLNEFLIKKGRHGLVFPWAGMPPDRATGRDCYLIPFKPDDPIPEFIELLDNVQLPKKRTRDMMLGIFILQKDRIAKAQASIPVVSTTPPLAPPVSLPVDPTPAVPVSIPNLGALASLLPPGGLNDQTKSLLQGLMASGGLAAVASSLAQGQASAGEYGTAAYQPPPITVPPYPGATPPYGGAMPPPATYAGYAPPASGAPSYTGVGPSSSVPGYGQAGPGVHPSRQTNFGQERNHPYGRSPSPEHNRRYNSGDYGRGPPDDRRYSGDRSPPRDGGWRRDGPPYRGRGGRGRGDRDRDWDRQRDDRGWRGRGRW